MKIAVVGCGALGSFYGARLGQAGHELHFLLRSDYDVVRRNGLTVESPWGDIAFHPHCALDPESIGPVDLVLIGLKTTANSQFERLLKPLVNDSTTLLTLQNGLGNEERLAEIFPEDQIMGGLCFVCINRVRPGHIVHLDHGKVVLGEFRRKPGERTELIAQAFRDGGVPCDVAEDLDRAHWEKLVWNIPFNGLGVASSAGLDSVVDGKLAGDSKAQPCLTTDQLLGHPDWERLVAQLMGEVIAVANAHGHPIPADLADRQMNRTRSMGAYRASTLVDYEAGRELELESLFLAPLRQAHRVGVPVPRLEALSSVLSALVARKRD